MTSFGAELSKLSSNELSASERKLLAGVIDAVIADLDEGHSCSNLADIANNLQVSITDLNELCASSDLVGKYTANTNFLEAKPLTSYWVNSEITWVYLTKYLYYEQLIVRKVRALNQSYPFANHQDFNVLLSQLSGLKEQYELPNQEQLQAVKASACHQLSIISGGPGTGKTTTITLLLWLFYQLYRDEQLDIKVCAPTGKAVNRVKESITASLEFLQQQDLVFDHSGLKQLLADSNSFLTIHKLLGYKKNSIYFRHTSNNPLTTHILIIDESSMISLTLFSKLLAAINPHQTRHIIFLGDKNQLSSVEEGHVFASLINYSARTGSYCKLAQIASKMVQPDLFGYKEPSLALLHTDSHENKALTASELLISNRSKDGIAKLANAVLHEDIKQFIATLDNFSDIRLMELNLNRILEFLFMADSAISLYLEFIKNHDFTSINLSVLFAALNQQIVLCVTNVGKYGADNINLWIEKKIKQALQIDEQWYNGRPIMILKNDYSLNIFNGDIGICKLENGRPIIVFADGKELIVEILPRYQLAYALTIHKAQGSEYKNVTLIIPELLTEHNIISKELIYTAITRAKATLSIFASKDTLIQGIICRIKRNSGMEHLLTAMPDINLPKNHVRSGLM